MQLKNKLTIGSLEFKITNDKLYIDTISGSETYALRSINGITVRDNINLFNTIISKNKAKIKKAYRLIITGILALIFFLVNGWLVFGLVTGSIIILSGVLMLGNKEEPRLKSYVTISMNSGEKSFSFFKDDANSGDVADFVATLEDTLTAFHKD